MLEDGSIQIPGNPTPCARARITKRGFAFDPKAAEKKNARKIVLNQWKEDPLKEPISLDISFGMPIPKSTSKKKHAQLIGEPHVIKPDCDNLAKFALDVMNGIVYDDDSCVFDLRVTKHYSAAPQTLIKITRN